VLGVDVQVTLSRDAESLRLIADRMRQLALMIERLAQVSAVDQAPDVEHRWKCSASSIFFGRCAIELRPRDPLRRVANVLIGALWFTHITRAYRKAPKRAHCLLRLVSRRMRQRTLVVENLDKVAVIDPGAILGALIKMLCCRGPAIRSAGGAARPEWEIRDTQPSCRAFRSASPGSR
jgi:hypothetical protein